MPTIREKHITTKIPSALVGPVDELRDRFQNAGVSIKGRQVIGRDGIAMALLAEATTLPFDEVQTRVLAGIEVLRKCNA